jgi:hypothetical protein
MLPLEWCVPLQKLEMSKVVLGNLMTRLNREKKPMAQIAYNDTYMRMPVLTLLLPHGCVESYNPASGRLDLHADQPGFHTKIQALQTTLLNSVFANQQQWFGGNIFSQDEIHRLFQPILNGTVLQLYCPSTPQEKRKGMGGIRIWKDGVWEEGVQPGLFNRGQRIRVVLQIQGISLQVGASDGNWTGRSRLQHRILGIIVQSPKCLIQSSEEQILPVQ